MEFGFFSLIQLLNEWLWSYLGLTVILLMGVLFSWQLKFAQIRYLPRILRNFFALLTMKQRKEERGIHPVKAFFASVGGCIGIGNVVGVTLAVKIGGPGALFWIWVTGLCGMMLKYAEVYLGITFREKNREGSYNGGPMYYLQKAFSTKVPAILSAILLCHYSVEIYAFNVIVESISTNWEFPKFLVVVILLLLCLIAVQGGVERVGGICSAIIPFFLLLFMGMSLFIVCIEWRSIIPVLTQVFSSAFTGHAAIGAFAGSTVIYSMMQGAKQGSYSGDIGSGFASILQSESSAKHPQKQAELAILGIFLDTFIICSLSVFLVLLTGVWQQPVSEEMLLQHALSIYFPYMHFFMPLFLFLLGYSTLIAYIVVGVKCADFLSSSHGKKLFTLYSIIAFLFFSFFDPSEALVMMNLSGGLLLILNSSGIYRLRHHVRFEAAPTLKASKTPLATTIAAIEG